MRKLPHGQHVAGWVCYIPVLASFFRPHLLRYKHDCKTGPPRCSECRYKRRHIHGCRYCTWWSAMSCIPANQGILHRSITALVLATERHLMQWFPWNPTQAFGSQDGRTFSQYWRNISLLKATINSAVENSFCCMAWGALGRPRFVWGSLRICLTSKYSNHTT